MDDQLEIGDKLISFYNKKSEKLVRRAGNIFSILIVILVYSYSLLIAFYLKGGLSDRLVLSCGLKTLFYYCFMILISFCLSEIYGYKSLFYKKEESDRKSFSNILSYFLIVGLLLVIGISVFYFAFLFLGMGFHPIKTSLELGKIYLSRRYPPPIDISVTHHFQLLVLFYVPLFIAWLSFLLIMSFGPFLNISRGYGRGKKKIYFNLPGFIAWAIAKKAKERIKPLKSKPVDIPVAYYFLFFFRSLVHKSAFPFGVGLGIHLALFAFPFINVLLPEVFPRFTNFSREIAYPSFLFSTIVLFLAPIVYSYFNIEELYGSYSAYHIKTKILNRLRDHYVILGCGNLGQNILKHTIWRIFLKGEDGSAQRKTTTHFEIIIDGNLDAKAIASNFVIINLNKNAFSQIYNESSSISFGFIEHPKDKNLLLLGILGDARNPASLKLARCEFSKLIIDATPDEQLPLLIYHQLIERACIFTVPDGSAFSILLRDTYNKDIFLTFPALIGSSSISSLLFLFYESLKNSVGKSSLEELLQCRGNEEYVLNNRILIIGKGRELFYIIERFKSLLAHEIDDPDLMKSFVEKAFMVLSDDDHIRNQMTLKEGRRGHWNIAIDRHEMNRVYHIPLYFQNPFNTESLNEVITSPDCDDRGKGRFGLICIYGKEQSQSLKILMNVQNVLRSMMQSKKNESEQLPFLLVEAPAIDKDLVKGELRSYNDLGQFAIDKYPSQRDLLAVRDYSVTDEIASVVLSWEQEIGLPGSISVAGPICISLCISDHPGTLTKCLLLLSGFALPRTSGPIRRVPSFHASNSIFDRKDPNSYIYEGVVSLEESSQARDFLQGVLVNSGEKHCKIEIECIHELLLRPLKGESYADLIEKTYPISKCAGSYYVCPISIVSSKLLSARTDTPCKNRLSLFNVQESKTVQNRTFAKIWIYGHKAKLPGALAIGLKDLLFIRWEDIVVDLRGYKNLINVKYISNIECPEQASVTLRNIYAVIESIDIVAQREQLREGTLDAVCIKTTGSQLWDEYVDDLLEFLNTEYGQYGNEYFLFNELKSDLPYCSLILRKNQKMELYKRILRKIEVFWDTTDDTFLQGYLDKIMRYQ